MNTRSNTARAHASDTWRVRVKRSGKYVIAYTGTYAGAACWARKYGEGEESLWMERKTKP